MAINTQIPLGVQPLQLKMPDPNAGLNSLAQTMQIEGAQNQNALAQYGLSKAKRQDAQMNALMTGLQGGQFDLTTPQGQAKAFSMAPEAAGPIIKNFLDAQVSRSTEKKNNSEAGKFDAEAAAKTTALYRDQLANVNDPATAAAWMKAQYADPVLGKLMQSHGPVDAAIAQIPTDPQGFNQWRQQNALGMTKFIELNAPKTSVVNTGGVTQMVQSPGLGGPPTVAGTFTNTVSPDASLSSRTQITTTGMNNATSRANTAATLDKDFKVAGINPDGTSTGTNDAIVDAIGQYKVAPPNGMALRNPRMQQILAEVTQKYPNFDATQYGARQVAAKAFSTGPQAQQVQAGNTALNHLDTIEQLALAQKNGNIQLFNKVANAIAAQTGQPAPTNLQAAITMVAPEITKAVVGAGGGIEDRAKAAAALNPNFSPDQLLGSVGAIKELFGGRLAETARTYQRSTGRADFADTFLSPAAQKVLAARGGMPTPAVPSDIAAILQKHGGK